MTLSLTPGTAIGEHRPDDADLIPIDAVRHAREIERARKARREKMIGSCGRGVREPCGMLDQEACRMHGPLLPEIK